MQRIANQRESRKTLQNDSFEFIMSIRPGTKPLKFQSFCCKIGNFPVRYRTFQLKRGAASRARSPRARPPPALSRRSMSSSKLEGPRSIRTTVHNQQKRSFRVFVFVCRCVSPQITDRIPFLVLQSHFRVLGLTTE